MSVDRVRVGHINIRSILPKIHELSQLLEFHKLDVLAVSETWLNSNTSNCYVNIAGYGFFHRNRIGRGGGVGIFFRDTFQCTLVSSSEDIEQLWIRLTICKVTFLVGSVYKPPSILYNVFLDHLENTISTFLCETDRIYCCGDFNINLFSVDSPAVAYFEKFLESLGAVQLVSKPTRVTMNTSTLLDYIVTTSESTVVNTDVINCELSDHDFIFFDLLLDRPHRPVEFRTYRAISQIDLIEFQRCLDATPFHLMLSMYDVNLKVDFLNNCLINLFDVHAPIVTRKFSKPRLPWITSNIKLLMTLRDNAKQRYSSTKLQEHWQYYKSLRNFTATSIINEKRAYFRHMSNSGDSRSIWRNLRSMNILKCKNHDIPQHLSDPNAINDYFINAIPASNGSSSYNYNFMDQEVFSHNNFTFNIVETATVSDIILNLKSNAEGCDGISAAMLRLCCPHIIPYVTHIINCCILDCIVPESWKLAIISPLPKVKNPESYSDMRPISILPILSKVFEKIIQQQLAHYVSDCGILPMNQSGFRPGYSCTTAMLSVTDDILKATDMGLVTLLVLLDYSKAFDTVSHEILLSLLSFIGLSREAVNLLNGYLSNRRQVVFCNNNYSNSVAVTKGVPQGSVLGPLLFSIYTSQFLKNVKFAKTHIYADDTQLYLSFPRDSWQEAMYRINYDLDYIFKISSLHNLLLNPNKSKCILFGNASSVKYITEHFQVKINNERIPFYTEVKILGLVLDNTLRYRQQISRYISNSYLALRTLYPHRKYLPISVKKSLCDAIVLSQFNYCAPVYHASIDACTSVRIQRIQNSCLRYIYGIRKFEHISHKLHDACWLNMFNRRKLLNLCLFHRIIVQNKPPYLCNRFSYRSDIHNVHVRFRGLISPPQHKLALYERSFSYQIYYLYNSVPVQFKLLGVGEFKRRMREQLLVGQFG